MPDRLPASKQKFLCSRRGHRLWSFSSWLCLLCSKFRAWSLIKRFCRDRREIPSRQPATRWKVLSWIPESPHCLWKISSWWLPPVFKSSFNPLNCCEVYHRKIFWQCAIVIDSCRICYCSFIISFAINAKKNSRQNSTGAFFIPNRARRTGD